MPVFVLWFGEVPVELGGLVGDSRVLVVGVLGVGGKRELPIPAVLCGSGGGGGVIVLSLFS